MRIKVLRDYSGEEGTGVDKNVLAGTKHTVTATRAKALEANGLVEIIDHGSEAKDAAVGTASDEAGSKAAAAPENKKAPEPANKAAPGSAEKSA